MEVLGSAISSNAYLYLIERVNSIYNAGYGPFRTNYTRQNARVLCRVMYIEGKMYEYAKSLGITLITLLTLNGDGTESWTLSKDCGGTVGN